MFCQKRQQNAKSVRILDMNIRIVNKSKHALPQHQTPHSAAVDVVANLDASVVVEPGKRVLIPTGLYFVLPIGYEAQLRPRSGLALKHGITLANSPGTIDADYRGECGVIVINHGQEPYTINDGDRIAQLVVAKHETIDWQEVDSLETTDRAGGFGSTGK